MWKGERQEMGELEETVKSKVRLLESKQPATVRDGVIALFDSREAVNVGPRGNPRDSPCPEIDRFFALYGGVCE